MPALKKRVCGYCGKEAGHPHNIRGIIIGFQVGIRSRFGTPTQEIQDNMDRTGYPDPDAKYHQHGR
jgi:hypothetical protein